jgi:hypothetical protein
MIASKTIPSYAAGTDYHPGGPALVGDGGRPEMVITPSGQIWKTPPVDTIVSLPKGAEVLPDFRRAILDMNPFPKASGTETAANGFSFEHDEVLRRNAGETNRYLSRINRGVNAIRANSRYSEKKARLMYRIKRNGFN